MRPAAAAGIKASQNTWVGDMLVGFALVLLGRGPSAP